MRAVAAVVAPVVAGSLIVAKEARHGQAASGKTVVAAVRMLPEGGSGVRGVAFFRQQDLRLSGWVAVWGLAPRTAHAVHFHAPGRCGGPPADAVAAHRDLVADRNGVAFLRLSVRVSAARARAARLLQRAPRPGDGRQDAEHRLWRRPAEDNGG